MSNTKIAEMEAQLALMQKEIESMKQKEANESEHRISGRSIYGKHKQRLEAARKDLANVYREILHEENIHSITTYISVGKSADTGKVEMLCCGTGMFSSLDDLNEEGIAAALDVYTNPRRIAILKALVKSEMTPSEISQQTRLQGGQLYHHLSILESAKLITKATDKYKADDKVPGLLCGLYAVIGGMDIAGNTP